MLAALYALEPMSIVQEIAKSWGWIGIDPVEVVGENDFGNLMIKDVRGEYWRLCPEELSCEVVAKSREELDQLSADQEFLSDWYMQALVKVAIEENGPLASDKKFCFAIPCVLGGKYEASNIKTASLLEMIRFSGDVALQIKDLPDGEKVQLKVLD